METQDILNILNDIRKEKKQIKESNKNLIRETKETKEMTKEAIKELERNVPALVTREMVSQITGYLNNHVAMQDILSFHAGNLNQKLYLVAEEILNKIVNEERYHTLYLKLEQAAKEKVDRMIEEKKKVWIEQMQFHEVRFNKMLDEHRKRIEEELNNISKTNKRMDKLQDSISSLQIQNYFLTAISFFFGSVLLYNYLSK